jgi:hypothetical protein
MVWCGKECKVGFIEMGPLTDSGFNFAAWFRKKSDSVGWWKHEPKGGLQEMRLKCQPCLGLL